MSDIGQSFARVDFNFDTEPKTGKLNVTVDALNNEDLSGVEFSMVGEREGSRDYKDAHRGQLFLRTNSERNQFILNNKGKMLVIGPDADKFFFDNSTGALYFDDGVPE